MWKNLLLGAAVILFSISIGYFAVGLKKYEQVVNYWGADYVGNGYWLHPANKNLVKIERRTRYQGKLISLTKTAGGDLEFRLKHTLEIIENQPESFTFTSSNLVNPIKIARDSDPIPGGWYVRNSIKADEFRLGIKENIYLAMMVTEDLYPVKSPKYISSLTILNEKNSN